MDSFTFNYLLGLFYVITDYLFIQTVILIFIPFLALCKWFYDKPDPELVFNRIKVCYRVLTDKSYTYSLQNFLQNPILTLYRAASSNHLHNFLSNKITKGVYFAIMIGIIQAVQLFLPSSEIHFIQKLLSIWVWAEAAAVCLFYPCIFSFIKACLFLIPNDHIHNLWEVRPSLIFRTQKK
jgi:hypothetical protein